MQHIVAGIVTCGSDPFAWRNIQSTMDKLLSSMTVRLRVRIGPNGWKSTLAGWGDADDPCRSFQIRTREAGTNEWDTVRQNYASYRDADGRCDVLEATVSLRSHIPVWSSMRIGVPVARIGRGRTYEIAVRFNGNSLALFVDGVLVDEDYPVGKIPSSPNLKAAGAGFDGEVEHLEIIPRALSDAEIVEIAGGNAVVSRRELEILGPERTRVQYWTPRGHNQWVGDVMFGDMDSFDPGRLHLYYLTNRRHGSSKFSQGGDFVAQMSSTDLLHWEQHPVSVQLDEWNSLGTGRPVVHDGKLLLIYGMHTTRIFPEDSTATVKTAGEGDTTVPIEFPPEGKLPDGSPDAGKYPVGTTYATSDDGIVFRKSGLLIHECQNPMIERAENGPGYLMLAGYGSRGLWTSPDLMHWRSKDPDILPLHAAAPLRNSCECQCMFEWNGFHYIVGGRTGFWMSRNQCGPYWEGSDGKNEGVIKPRWDIYEGLWVPMVARFGNNRRILAGFLAGQGFEWGGHLVFRELIQEPDGTLGLKWPEELRPVVTAKVTPKISTGGKNSTGEAVTVSGDPGQWAEVGELPESFHISVRISSEKKTTHVAIAGLGEDGSGCALSVLTGRGRVQWGTVAGAPLPQPVPSLPEMIAASDQWLGNMEYAHFKGVDFVITDVEGTGAPFDLEMMFVWDPKSDSTIIDACIGGNRTLITRRTGLRVKRLRLMADGPAGFENITIGKIDSNL